MKPLVSIIIPVYNVADFLSACIDSVICQTYKELEILLINDGSSDNSGNICEDYAKKDHRIKVIHKSNGGLSDARNTGLNIARGEFISFVDSDDIIHKNFIHILLSLLMDSEATIAMCDYAAFSTILPEVTEFDNSFKLYSGRYMLDNLYSKKWLPKNVIACNKVYKRSVWEELRYPVGVLHEDEYIIHHLFDKADLIAFSSLPLYFYRQRDTSITKEISHKRIQDTLAIFDLRTAYFNEKGYNHLIEQNSSARLLNIAILAITYRNNSTRQLLKQNLMPILKQLDISLKMKCSCVIVAIFPKLFWAMKNLRKKTI
jgi:glycosyltransferase involved in cell wall biosynthesis